MRRRLEPVPLAVVTVFVAVIAVLWIRNLDPFLDAPRPVSEGTGTPNPIFNPSYVPLRTGRPTCVRGVVLGTRTERISFVGQDPTGSGPPIGVRIAGPGYRSSATVRGGWASNAVLTARVAAPGREVRGEVCFENRGRRAITLLGTSEAQSTAQTFVAGRPAPQVDLSLSVTRDEPVPLTARADLLFERATSLSWGPLGTWTGWVLTLLLAIGMPLAVVAALATTVREQRRRADWRPPAG